MNTNGLRHAARAETVRSSGDFIVVPGGADRRLAPARISIFQTSISKIVAAVRLRAENARRGRVLHGISEGNDNADAVKKRHGAAVVRDIGAA
ncbi:hypothetical protein WM40_00010 [Robbsia andropogonis]|uniref:Uncharacterized protein n=1 Tax=Robbsia andropogonis TaxID=28092 RepID=A0A0F5K5A9_9BURK|nr:hypothetical protein WM40_00010 [Robbsia andropogonis]